MPTQTTFTCKCGKQKGWIAEDSTTTPCPDCGRRYLGVYNPKTLSIEAREIPKEAGDDNA